MSEIFSLIIPPKEWHAVRRYNMKKIGEMEIKTPILQTVSGQQGLFQLINIQKKTMKVKEFKETAETQKYRPPEGTVEELERKFWKNITFNPAIYGADIPGTIYDKDVKYWNINSLNTILDTLNSECNVKILGVNTAYLYFGMWKTTFPWHTEDVDLYSINYLHYGASKFWYSISPEQGKRLETLAKGFFSGSAQDCSQFMRHKMTMISPQILKKFSIPVNKICQEEGEFMVTFPYGYHSGFNLGFNIAESTNFASERWIEYGKRAKHCQCDRDSVKIDMDIFIRKFQPEEWKKLQQVRRKDAKIDVHRKRKTARANYSSDSKDTEEEDESEDEKDDNNTTVSTEEEEEEEDENGEEDEEEEEVEDTESTEAEEDTSSDEATAESDDDNKEPENNKKKDTSLTQNPHKRKIIKNGLIKRTSERQKIKKVQSLKVVKKEEKQESDEERKEREEETTKKPIKNGVCLSLRNVWKFESEDKHAEDVFNKRLSETETKCAICIYFSQRDAEYLHTGTNGMCETNKRHSLNELKAGKLLVTELCFAMNKSEEATIETAFNLMFGDQEAKEVSLLHCARCRVAVHSACYGVDMDQVTSKWYCQKCQYLQQQENSPEDIDIISNGPEQTKEISCCLCLLRGGALKKTTQGSWCHVICAIAFPEVYFEDKKKRNGINIDSLNPARLKLNCIYCSHLKKPSTTETIGACVQCQCGKCATPFHVTCSFHNGVPLYLGDWPLLIETLCSKHCRKNAIKSEKRELTSIADGDIVFAKHKNGRYYQGRVISVSSLLYYKVVFADKSFCFDLPPDDIQGVDAKNNVLPVGEMVNILWPDSVMYHAEVTGHWYDTVSQVRFEDSSILNVKRSDLFLEGEDIPKRIKSKMSYASETANKLFLPESLRNASKRPRVGIRKCQSTHKKL